MKVTNHTHQFEDCGTAGYSLLDCFTVNDTASIESVRHFSRVSIQSIAPSRVVPAVCQVTVTEGGNGAFNVIVERFFNC